MRLSNLSAFLLLAGYLSACGKEAPAPQIAKEASAKYDKAVTLQGTVSNNAGPIKAGKVEAMSLADELLAETTLENSARYQLQIPAGTTWPVVLNFLPGTGAAGAEKMLSIAIQPTTGKYDINPSTTAIAKQAKSLGGYTLRNLTRAAEDRVNVPDANKTSTGFRGDPTTQYGGWH